MLIIVYMFCRVEILENIFSLLFLRYDDVQEEASSDSGANDDDGDCSTGVPKSEIVSKCADSTAYKNLGGTEVTHDMISFQQVCDVSSSLRTMPVIEAHISGSPPLELSVASPGEPLLHQPSLPRPDDMSLTDSESPLEATDMSSLSKMSGGSPVNVFSQAGGREKCSSPLTATFDKPSSSLSGAVTTSLSTSAEHSSLPDRYSMTNVVTANSVQSVSLSVDVTSDFLKLPVCGDVNQSSKPRQSKKSTKNSPSENASVPSGASSMTTGSQQGFMCSQHLIRDLLHCLKECLVETSAAFYSSLTMDTVDVRKIEVSSIQPELLQQRMNR